jgi:hypothetical protein
MKLMAMMILMSILLVLGATLQMTSSAHVGLIMLTVGLGMLWCLGLLQAAGDRAAGTRTDELLIGDWLESSALTELNQRNSLKVDGRS